MSDLFRRDRPNLHGDPIIDCRPVSLQEWLISTIQNLIESNGTPVESTVGGVSDAATPILIRGPVQIACP
jgi:hypothetical protein